MADTTERNYINVQFEMDVECGGYTGRVIFSGRAGDLPAYLSKLRGYQIYPVKEHSAPAPQPAANGTAPRKPKPPADAPLFNADGDALCPHHGTVLREGRFGPFCPSRAEGDLANDKGYCRYKPPQE